MATTPPRKAAGKRTASKKAAASSPSSDSNPELAASDDVRTAIISGLNFGPKAVQYAAVDGRAMFEGDIDLGSVEEVEKSNDAVRGLTLEEAVVLPGSQFRWPQGRVPYEIDSGMPDQQRVHDAIAHWEQNTVIRFILRTPANAASHPNFVHFMHGNGCSSPVGMKGGQQNITMGTGCDAGRGIHEIGHSIGLWHEQSREDRDLFVKIHFENIEVGKEHNFNQHISDGDDVGAYDYGSIMHYERTAFSKDNVSETITPINPAGAQIGQRVALSAGDLNAVASMYGAPPVVGKQVLDPPFRVKKVVDDTGGISKQRVDPPTNFKKIVDDGPGGIKQQIDPPTNFKKVVDDIQVVEPPFPPRPPVFRPGGGISPFVLATGHQADVAGGPGGALDPATAAALEAALQQAGVAVEEATRNVVALQTALSAATSELASAQEAYAAVVAAVQGQ